MTDPVLNISAYVVCRDEENMIEACIRSLEFCNEIVIVDSGSTDRTLKIVTALKAEGFPIRLFEREWPGYARQKQFALEQCTSEWCLCLDADERADRALVEALPAHLARTDVNAWRIRFVPYLFGYGYAPPAVRNDAILRLSRKGKAAYDVTRLVHEALQVQGETGTIEQGRLLHRRALTVGEQMRKAVNYSELKAQQLFNARKGPRRSRLLLNGWLYFLRLYFGRRMFLCGWAGYIQARTVAVYSFMTEAALLQMYAAEQDRSEPDPDDVFLHPARN
ncbi:glycosyltransferase family 2 protein [Oricola cellulosilytica]|nr:glycosyltransferase family 2 protein [Oricola cellulosilytica]